MNLKGYVSVGLPVPVSVQNLVLRDYCQRRGHVYYLADVEYVQGGAAMLHTAMAADCDGVVAYSMFMQPREAWQGFDKPIHFALENYIWPRDFDACVVAWALKGAA